MPRRSSGSGGSKAGFYAAVLLGLAACLAAVVPGDYEINTMAPVIDAPREKVFRYLSDPRNFANLAPVELQYARPSLLAQSPTSLRSFAVLR